MKRKLKFFILFSLIGLGMGVGGAYLLADSYKIKWDAPDFLLAAALVLGFLLLVFFVIEEAKKSSH